MITERHSAVTPGGYRALALAGLFLAELVALALAYQVLTDFECADSGAVGLCAALSSMVARAVVVMAVAGLLVWSRPRHFNSFLNAGAGAPWALPLHLTGVALLFLPLVIATPPGGGLDFGLALIPWLSGAILASLGGLAWLAPLGAWRALGAAIGPRAFLALLLAAIIPDIVVLVGPIWNVQSLTDWTFAGVAWMLSLSGDQVTVDPATYIIGLNGFLVRIAQQCSGIEGAVLVVTFGLLYAGMFRGDLRLGRFLMLVLPLAVLVSWLLNLVRITVLILIGARVSPDLAVNGFHSHAGWVFFSVVALGLIWLAEASPWLHRNPARAARPGLAQDPVAALILPFAAFMLASLLTHALFAVPDIGYALRVVAMVAALWLFRRIYLQWAWTPDPVAIGAGLAVGAGWIALALWSGTDGSDLAAALDLLSPAALVAWVMLRLIGTVVLVPLVEEAFFRGYLLTRLDLGGLTSRMIAIVVTSVLFAALHGQWLAAGIAGVVFALIMLRRGRLVDAVIAHMAANLAVAAWALSSGNWSLI